MLKFQNKVILVTGSGTGIGQTVAKLFAENGASIIILGRRKEPLEETKKILDEIISRVKSNAKVWLFSGVDVSDETGVSQMFDSLKNSNVSVDVVVNNAGVSGPVTCFSNAPLEEFKSTVAIHLTGTFWTSTQALKVMKPGAKIVTISTFFTEERPFEQRPYRFRSPYTASQGAKNRLAEAMSWELAEKGIVSIATNPGPVHSDRIYKTVYPKAAAEFLRTSGFEDLTPSEVEAANKEIVGLLGENEQTVKDGIAKAASAVAKMKNGDAEKIAQTLARLLAKIQEIAEKVQKNTSFMIADRQFLSQMQVAQTVMTLADDDIAKILNGKVIPGDRVFYPVKPHITTSAPQVHQPDFASQVFVFTIDATDKGDAERAAFLAQHVEKNGGKAVCLISNETSKENQELISSKFHSHTVNLKSPEEIQRWLNAAKNIGKISAVVHITGKVPQDIKIIDLSRKRWDDLVDKFVNTPATVLQSAFEMFVPGGSKDPRLYKDASGTAVIIGPDMPSGAKISGSDRARVEVFRGALRPFATTVNQELSDVLKSKVRSFLVLPGGVDGKESDNAKITQALNYFVTDTARRSSEITFCVDETRE
ncbi:SDR family oxidoreductase [Candidatus Nitrosotenuis cloacae]|jgi:NAD(P)-dependent dehydrogenase (short-subunit alcohol dehydrogenase family)|uniref:SDR family oxidoreductase n=1 Tax=Candidatus Nitrosotenuis cloacae TaxID=1603555 RepID=UPI00227E27D5|nr:SDR family oxidoreductase [Candidatus Nitrosotenuis cloacae]